MEIDNVPIEYLQQLKHDFSASKDYEGYDPGEDPGYFTDYLIARLYARERIASLYPVNIHNSVRKT